MPLYRIFRMKDWRRQNFRLAPHTRGLSMVKPGEYEQDGEIDAPSPYAAWAALRATEKPLDIGDILEFQDGNMRICKYVGFEEAQWHIPEVKSGLEADPVAAGQPPIENHVL
jgi:hypothetical protein